MIGHIEEKRDSIVSNKSMFSMKNKSQVYVTGGEKELTEKKIKKSLPALLHCLCKWPAVFHSCLLLVAFPGNRQSDYLKYSQADMSLLASPCAENSYHDLYAMIWLPLLPPPPSFQVSASPSLLSIPHITFFPFLTFHSFHSSHMPPLIDLRPLTMLHHPSSFLKNIYLAVLYLSCSVWDL